MDKKHVDELSLECSMCNNSGIDSQIELDRNQIFRLSRKTFLPQYDKSKPKQFCIHVMASSPSQWRVCCFPLLCFCIYLIFPSHVPAKKLENMVGEKLPISLIKLSISGCPLLQKRCRTKHHSTWPKISHIRDIK
ncbi:hypothetical protein CR513_60134, partial [Mucuna pruriens]